MRVSRVLLARIKAGARAEGLSMAAFMAAMLREHLGRRLLDQANEAYARLEADPLSGASLAAERTAWDSTLGDGLPGDEVWDPPGARRDAQRKRSRRKRK